MKMLVLLSVLGVFINCTRITDEIMICTDENGNMTTVTTY